MKVVITAAGLGTRLLPATSVMPKVMLPLGKKPAIQYVVEEAVASGIKDIIFIVGPDDTMIMDYFSGDKKELIAELRKRGKNDYANELESIKKMANYEYIVQEDRLGLGDAVLRARKSIGNEPFAILYGDGPVIDADPPRLKQLIDVHNKYNGAPVIAAKMVPDHMVSKYGIIDYENIKGEKNVKLVKRIVEKPKPEDTESRCAISAGCILTPDVFDILAKLKPGVGGEIQLADAQNKLAGMKEVYAVLYNGERLDVGNELSYAQATVEMALRNVKGFEEWLEQRYEQ